MESRRRRHPTAEWLSNYGRLTVEIEAKQEQLRRLSRSPVLFGAIAETERQLLAAIEDLAEAQLVIRQTIDGVENHDWRALLEYRYLVGWSWSRIAEKMHYGRSTIWRMHKKALNSLTPPEC